MLLVVSCSLILGVWDVPNRVIDLGDDDSPDAIRAMMQHIYGLPYDQPPNAEAAANKDLLFHVGVFAVADKYDVPTLRVLVVSKFKILLHDQPDLKVQAPAFEMAYQERNDHALQKAICKYCAYRTPHMFADKDFI